jgi:hypothetical protein
MKKEKIIELKIEDEDEISGIDSISLVDEPAIMVNWIAFKKEMKDINLDVYGYKTKYFQICPGAVATFEHLVSMDNDDDTIGMIRSAAVVADSIFKIEDDVLKAEKATQEQLDEATVLVDDFEDIIEEIDEISGMEHDVDYMEGHIETIASYLREEMEKKGPCWPGYQQIGTKMLNGKEVPNCVPISKENMKSVSDYPESIKNNAKRVLKYVEENGWGDCGTDVGKQRANQLAKGEPITLDTIKRMYSYLSRHEVDLDSSKGYDDGCGKLMYDSWGGKSALSWAESKLNDFGYDVGTISGYVDPGIKKKKKNDMSNQRFAADNEKHIVLGPAMVPDQKIFRKDDLGNPYYVFFSPETIKMIAEKYMRNKYIDNNDEMHNGKAVKDVYVIESWIKEDDNDKSNKYGFNDLPVGTWFVSMKINNPNVWDKVKKGELNGFSVSGYFEEVAQFTKEEMFLYKVSELLRNINE